MYHVGIDISKFKHYCFIATEASVKVKAFALSLKALGKPKEMKIGFESTGHYGTNLKYFISKMIYTYLEMNAYLVNRFATSLSLRKTKTDKVDAKIISSM